LIRKMIKLQVDFFMIRGTFQTESVQDVQDACD
jgi:hypothetical protein